MEKGIICADFYVELELLWLLNPLQSLVERVTWVVQAQEGSSVEIRVRAQKSGTDSTTITLR